ncbi:MAG: hypothetical protein MRY64_01550 [Hyphomonadaceae bacterium]|nr:hypothetical protein [Hyphomonadaceae bacterium]
MGIKTPPGYKHPLKHKQRGPEVQSLAAAKTAKPRIPIGEKEGSGSRRQGQNPTQVLKHTDEKVRVRVVAYEPKPGQFERYDAMRRSGISDKDALLGFLRSARGKIGVLVDCSAKDIDTLTLDQGPAFVETNWSLSRSGLAQIKSLLDPFGILTPRALGAKIGAAVIVLNESD